MHANRFVYISTNFLPPVVTSVRASALLNARWSDRPRSWPKKPSSNTVACVPRPRFSLDVSPDGLPDPAEHSQTGLGVRERPFFQLAHRPLAAPPAGPARHGAPPAQSERDQRVGAGDRRAVPGAGSLASVGRFAACSPRDFVKLSNAALQRYAGSAEARWERWLREQAERMVGARARTDG